MNTDIKRFLDEDGKVKALPAKRNIRFDVLNYIAAKFECGRNYSEKEVNATINDWHSFGDYFIIRRELVDSGLLSRTRDGSSYWKEEKDKAK